MITNEEWKKVNGFTKYEVSNFGRVRNIHTKELKAIRKTKTGYCITDLKENGKKKTAYIHRLVAEAFVENAFYLPCINHKDENKANNHADNLEWCTIAYNNNYHGRAKRVGEHHKKHHPLCKKVMCVETKEIFHSIQEASRKKNINHMCIAYCLNGKQKSAGGFRWVVVR